MPRILVVDNYESDERGPSRIAALTQTLSAAAEELDILVVKADSWGFYSKGFDAIVLSGGPSNPTSEAIQAGWMKQESEWLKRVVFKTKTPLIGICFGHELLGTTFGAKLAQREKEPQVLRRVRKVKDDPMLQREEYSLLMSHCFELASVPEGFELIAEGIPPASKVQIIKHADRPVYGVQGHLELGGDGLMLARGFLRLL